MSEEDGEPPYHVGDPQNPIYHNDDSFDSDDDYDSEHSEENINRSEYNETLGKQKIIIQGLQGVFKKDSSYDSQYPNIIKGTFTTDYYIHEGTFFKDVDNQLYKKGDGTMTSLKNFEYPNLKIYKNDTLKGKWNLNNVNQNYFEYWYKITRKNKSSLLYYDNERLKFEWIPDDDNVLGGPDDLKEKYNIKGKGTIINVRYTRKYNGNFDKFGHLNGQGTIEFGSDQKYEEYEFKKGDTIKGEFLKNVPIKNKVYILTNEQDSSKIILKFTGNEFIKKKKILSIFGGYRKTKKRKIKRRKNKSSRKNKKNKKSFLRKNIGKNRKKK